MNYLAYAQQLITPVALVGIYFLARRERREKDLLIEQNATMRLALRDASDELILAAAELVNSGKQYTAKCAIDAGRIARKAGAS